MYKYSHGGNAVFESGKENILDLSASINPLGMPENVINAVAREIPNCTHYPDSSSAELRNKIAEFENVKPEMILCGNGASDIIFRLPRAAQAGKIMITAPTFSDYERSARSFGAKVVLYPLSEGSGFMLDDGFLRAVRTERPDLIYICNPNNPTGKLTDIAFVSQLAGCCYEIGALLVLDECFLGFVQQSEMYTGKALLDKFSNLVILKAFTKLFALPGIRLGYAICRDRKLIESLYFHGADWSVSNLAQAAGMAALDGAEDMIKRTAAYVAAERLKIENELVHLGICVYKSQANYVFIRNPYDFDLFHELDKKGIRIRSCHNFHNLDSRYCRIAVSTAEINLKLLSAVGEIIISLVNPSLP